MPLAAVQFKAMQMESLEQSIQATVVAVRFLVLGQ
jgi:hypothetical protein